MGGITLAGLNYLIVKITAFLDTAPCNQVVPDVSEAHTTSNNKAMSDGASTYL
jgi:hypothetical protein